MAFSSRLLGHHCVFDAWTLSIWRRLRNVNARNGKGGCNGARKRAAPYGQTASRFMP